MKKLLTLGLISFALLNSSGAFAQKKKQTNKQINSTIPVIKTEADSLSYALGLNMVQGLPAYLTQMGVLTDTASINASYSAKIEGANGNTEKAKLEKELKFKLDSANTANNKNLNEFIEGFVLTMNQKQEKQAYNSGIAIAGQISGMIKNFSTSVLDDEDSFNKAAFVNAFISSLKNEKPLLDIASPEALIQNKAQKAEKEKADKVLNELKAQYADKIAEGEKFFAENKTKEGIVTSPSGLQYKIVKEGNGPVPSVNEKVKVHYHGTLLDGTVFDSSVNRGEPAEFSVGQLIRGFNEALMTMPEGSKWIIYIPYDLAYGAADQGVIKPFSDLIFEVELLKVNKAQ